MNTLKKCTLCPRECQVNRASKLGYCKAPQNPRVARAALHLWEEPCISGTNGSGTVFFSGCTLKCVYCQNLEISHTCFGKDISVERLAEIFCELQAQGAHNINLVSPTPYIPQIKAAIDAVRDKIKIPYIFNTGGYEKADTVSSLNGYIDIFLTDIKYYSSELSALYSQASNYFDCAISSAAAMIHQVGAPVFTNDGLMQSGVIIRHLVLPMQRRDSEKILELLAKRFQPNSFVLSLMSQYTPVDGLAEVYPEINRKVTTFEYRFVTDTALKLGFDNAYVQERDSASKKYTPPFDSSGV